MTYKPFVDFFPDGEDMAQSAAEGRTSLAAIIQSVDYTDDPEALRATLRSMLLALSFTTSLESDLIACFRAMGRLCPDEFPHYAQLEHWTDAPFPK